MIDSRSFGPLPLTNVVGRCGLAFGSAPGAAARAVLMGEQPARAAAHTAAPEEVFDPHALSRAPVLPTPSCRAGLCTRHAARRTMDQWRTAPRAWRRTRRCLKRSWTWSGCAANEPMAGSRPDQGGPRRPKAVRFRCTAASVCGLSWARQASQFSACVPAACGLRVPSPAVAPLPHRPAHTAALCLLCTLQLACSATLPAPFALLSCSALLLPLLPLLSPLLPFPTPVPRFATALRGCITM